MMNMAAMNDFRACQPEMLRAADYRKGHKKCSGTLTNPNVAGASVFGTASGFGMSSTTGSSGFGSAFRGSSGNSPFGGGSSSIFGSSNQQSSGAFGSSFGGSAFGQSSSGFGAFGQSSSSVFGSGTSTGFGQQAASSIFGAQSGSSIFGNQPSSSFGTTPFSGSAASGSNIFGQSTGSSIFGAASSAAFGTGFSGSSLFGPQSSSGFAFSGSGGSLFGNNPSPTFFGQTPTSQFGSFGQSNSFFSGSSMFPSQQQQSAFGQQQPQAQGGNLFGPTSAPQQQQPASGGYFVTAQPWQQDPSNKPNWTPEYGLVVPDASDYLKLGINPDPSAPRTNTYDYVRRDREKQFPHRFVTIPVKFAVDDQPSEKKIEKKTEPGWDSFAIARPTKVDLEDEIKQSIENFGKATVDAGQAASSSENRTTQVSFLAPSRDPQFDRNMQSVLRMEEERRNKVKSVDGLTQDQIRALLPKFSKSDYYIVPDLSGLEHLVTVLGKDALKNVPGVEIGRENYGKISFSTAVSLEKVDINAAIAIKRGRIAAGSEQSSLTTSAATVTLFKVFSKDKGRDGCLTSQSELLEEIEKFRKHTTSMNGEFVSYNKHGTWVFKVTSIPT